MTQVEYEQAADLVTDITARVKSAKGKTDIPDVTCPLIDEVISLVKDSMRILDWAAGRCDDNATKSQIEEALTNLSFIRMEPIRVANNKLRELGRRWYFLAAEISEEISAYVRNAELNDTPTEAVTNVAA